MTPTMTPAFAGATPLTLVSPFRGRAVCTSATARPFSGPRAVLGERTTVGLGGWGAAQAETLYTVKVMERDRCTLIQVDRDTNLRKALLDNKVDLYTLGGKLRNCGGGGQCGTCIIAIEDGVYSTNGRTPKEEFLLEGKPGDFRLACRTLISGDVTIRTKPQ